MENNERNESVSHILDTLDKIEHLSVELSEIVSFSDLARDIIDMESGNNVYLQLSTRTEGKAVDKAKCLCSQQLIEVLLKYGIQGLDTYKEDLIKKLKLLITKEISKKD